MLVETELVVQKIAVQFAKKKQTNDTYIKKQVVQGKANEKRKNINA